MTSPADRRKHIVGKPHAFQNGFYANRIARGEANNYPSATIDVVAVKHGKGRQFLIRKIEDGVETFFVSPNDGFLPIPGSGNGTAAR
jgi:hypothetical protein